MGSGLKGTIKKCAFKNNYTTFFSILLIISSIFTVFSFAGIGMGIGILNQINSIFPSVIWVLFLVSIAISGILAYYEKYAWMVLPIFIVLLIFTIQVRTSNIPQLIDVTTGEYTLGPDLDPFLYLRNVKEIISRTNLGDIDAMRYAPLGAPSFIKANLIPSAIVIVYKIASVFSNITPTFAAIIAPVIWFSISLIGFFLFTKLIFSFKLSKGKSSLIALIASFFYALTPHMLHRTTGGIPELESLAMAFFWFVFLFFTMAWKTDVKRKQIIYGVIAGILTNFMLWSWGGYRYIYMVLSLATLVIFFIEKEKRKNFVIFSSWLIPAIILEFIKNKSVITLLTNVTATGFALGVWGLMILSIIIPKLKIKKLNEMKLPNSFKSAIIGAGILIVIFLIVNPKGLIDLVSGVVEGLLLPYGKGRVGLTVAENKAPYLVEVISQFSYIIWLFFVGAIVLFYDSIKHFDKKNKIKLTAGFLIFIAAISFSRISGSSLLNGENFISVFVFIAGIAIFGLILISMMRKMHIENKEETISNFKKIDFSYILLLAFSFWAIISMRGAIRLFFIISPMVILTSFYLPIRLYNLRKNKDELIKIGSVILLVIVLILSLITFVQYSNSTISEAKATVPGIYEQQWQQAMGWVRENTPENSVFVHWWDYGYWVQTLGERPTVTDGGHYIGYWDHLIGRYVLTTPEPETAFSFMKTHDVSYLLIDSTDLGKYTAYSSIGSNKEFDRFAGIPLMNSDSSQTRETSSGTIIVYQGGWGVDEDINHYDLNNEEIFIPGPIYDKYGTPSYQAYVIGVTLEKNSATGELGQPKAVFIYQQKQITIPMRYLYVDGELTDFEGGLDSVFMLIPKATQGNSGLQYDEIGTGIYLSPKVSKSLFAQVYLLDNAFKSYNGLEIAHSEDDTIVAALENYGVGEVGQFIDFNGFRGPIKIWEVNYPAGTSEVEGFLNFSGDYAEFDDSKFTV